MGNLSKEQIHDVIGWDIESWGKFLDFIEETDISFKGKKVLDIGAGNGGLSLYFEWHGADVTCTDLKWRDHIMENHQKYGVQDKIHYRQIGINDLSQYYEGQFDIVVCKAVLGGIGRFNNGNQSEGVHEIYRCLKDGGYLIFSDSIKATPVHNLARKLFGSNWQYFTRDEIMTLCSDFHLVKEQYYGFIAPFTRILKEHTAMRSFFGKLDSIVFEHIIPNENRYLGAFLFQKRILQDGVKG